MGGCGQSADIVAELQDMREGVRKLSAAEAKEAASLDDEIRAQKAGAYFTQHYCYV